MQLNITPDFLASLSSLIGMLEHNPRGAANLVTLTALLMLALALTRHPK